MVSILSLIANATTVEVDYPLALNEERPILHAFLRHLLNLKGLDHLRLFFDESETTASFYSQATQAAFCFLSI